MGDKKNPEKKMSKKEEEAHRLQEEASAKFGISKIDSLTIQRLTISQSLLRNTDKGSTVRISHTQTMTWVV